jgi:predicted N-formylglutamate amidohydrolase
MTEHAFERIEPAGPEEPALLFVCDHASNALPRVFGTLGLRPALFDTHIACDIGAADVTRSLARAFGAPAILARWSRLLIDLNRGEDDPTLVMKLSDGAIVPGNVDVDEAKVRERIACYHAPYHEAIAAEIARPRERTRVPALISVHSFTPVWKGRARPWEIGVLWDRDDRLAKPLIRALREAGFSVGDNEPYSGELENDCMYRHGTMNGLPHVLIEIRQDLVSEPARAAGVAEKLEPVIADALTAMGHAQLRFTRPLSAGGRQMDEATRKDLEATVFRRLVAHLRERTDVQNIDLMIVGGFCRNCLGDWYREAAAEKGMAFSKDEAREIVYGMAPSEWKRRFQKDTTPEQQAAFERSQTIHK